VRRASRVLRALVGVSIAAAATAAGAEAQIKAWSAGATPRLEAKALDGKTVDLKSLKGRVVVVNFWATWCEPCRDELPALLQLKAKLAGKPFELLTVNYGENREKIAQYLQREKLAPQVLLDRDRETAKDWKVGGLPMTFVVDAKGRVRYWVFGERAWNEGESLALVERLLAEDAHARH
jgi:cytochrome c biogenesis protein CcmG, thiol:disulfide interchange protein DsbE